MTRVPNVHFNPNYAISLSLLTDLNMSMHLMNIFFYFLLGMTLLSASFKMCPYGTSKATLCNFSDISNWPLTCLGNAQRRSHMKKFASWETLTHVWHPRIYQMTNWHLTEWCSIFPGGASCLIDPCSFSYGKSYYYTCLPFFIVWKSAYIIVFTQESIHVPCFGSWVA